MITYLKTLLTNVLWMPSRVFKSYVTYIASERMSKSILQENGMKLRTATGTGSKKPIRHMYSNREVML